MYNIHWNKDGGGVTNLMTSGVLFFIRLTTTSWSCVNGLRRFDGSYYYYYYYKYFIICIYRAARGLVACATKQWWRDYHTTYNNIIFTCTWYSIMLLPILLRILLWLLDTIVYYCIEYCYHKYFWNVFK